jgi:hypothetical protein
VLRWRCVTICNIIQVNLQPFYEKRIMIYYEKTEEHAARAVLGWWGTGWLRNLW